MTYLMFCILATVVAAPLLVACFRTDLDSGWWLVGVVAVLLVFVLWLVAVGQSVANRMERNNCHKWGTQTELPVRWVQYNTFDHDCLVLVDGQWVSRDAIRVSVNP